MSKKSLPSNSSRSELDRFLADVDRLSSSPRGAAKGRLLFAMDATASRQPTWDRASHLQAQMFQTAAGLGGLSMSVCFFRGFGEFKASPWLQDGKALLRKMTTVQCLAGQTQISRVLRHALRQTKAEPIQAVVYIGDACEESAGSLQKLAGELGILNTPLFMFQEGRDSRTASVFEALAQRSGGAYCRFDSSSAELLVELLSAVAVYASGGRAALADHVKQRPRLVHLQQQLEKP